MKKFGQLLLIAILPGLVACSGTGTGNIKGNFKGVEGNTALFQRFEKGAAVTVDSAVVAADGSVSFNATDLPLDFYQIKLGATDKFLLVLEPGDEPMITADVADLYSATVEGSEKTKAFYAFHAKMKEFELEKNEVRNQLAAQQGNPQLTEQFNEIIAAQYKYITDVIDADPGSPVALTALGSLNMADDVDRYRQVRDAMATSMPNSGFYTQLNQRVDLVEQQLVLQKQQQKLAAAGGVVSVGNEAPDFAQQRPDGSVMKLSDLRGKVVLVDFWASWCKPCRRENPTVVAAYNKYKNKGFDIVGVSLDKDRGRWLNAIEADGLEWHHVSDLAAWNNAAAQQYGVSSIPFTVLVDKDGTVLATRLRGKALEQKLEEIFGA